MSFHRGICTLGASLEKRVPEKLPSSTFSVTAESLVQALQYSFDDLSLLCDFNDIEFENALSHKMESKTTGSKIIILRGSW